MEKYFHLVVILPNNNYNIIGTFDDICSDVFNLMSGKEEDINNVQEWAENSKENDIYYFEHGIIKNIGSKCEY